MLQCAAVCCSVLQRAAVCCSVLQCVAVYCSVLQCAAVRCSVLQCAAVGCSVLQRAAVCCSVLQCAAVCCSVLQRVALTDRQLPHLSLLDVLALVGSVLQRTPVCCGVLQCVAASYSDHSILPTYLIAVSRDTNPYYQHAPPRYRLRRRVSRSVSFAVVFLGPLVLSLLVFPMGLFCGCLSWSFGVVSLGSSDGSLLQLSLLVFFKVSFMVCVLRWVCYRSLF